MRWSRGMIEAGGKAGLDMAAPDKLERLLQETGFVDVTVQWQKWPIGRWAKALKHKEIGEAWAENLKIVTRGSSALFTRLLGWPSEEFDALADDIIDEINSGGRHMWFDL